MNWFWKDLNRLAEILTPLKAIDLLFPNRNTIMTFLLHISRLLRNKFTLLLIIGALSMGSIHLNCMPIIS